MKRLTKYLSVASAFITFCILAVYTRIVFSLGVSHATDSSAYASLILLLLSFIIYAVWTMTYFVIAQELVSLKIAYFSSLIFLILLYFTLYYSIEKMDFYVGSIAAVIISLGIFTLFVYKYSSRIRKYFEPFVTRFCVILLILLPFGLYLFVKIMPTVLGEGLQAFGLC